MTRRRVLLLATTIALTFLGPLVLYAAAQEGGALGGKVRTGDTIVVAASETVAGDLYAFGGTIRVEGTVEGDLVALGGTVDITGTVEGDVMAGAGTVTITGQVGGDARVGAGQLTVSGDVGEDLFAGSGALTLAGGGTVGGDLILATGDAQLAGNVTGGVVGSAGSYARTGTVGGVEQVQIGDAQRAEPAPARGAVDAAMDVFRQFVVVLIFGVLALWLLPERMRAAERAVRTRTVGALVGGFLAIVTFIVALIAILVAAVLIAIVADALGLGALGVIDVVLALLLCAFLVLAFVVASGFLAHAIVGFGLARLAMPASGATRMGELALLAIGAAAVVIATSVPVIGGILNLAVVLIGLGALFVVGRDMWTGRRSVAVVAPAPAPSPTP